MRKHRVSFYQIFGHLWVKEEADRIKKKKKSSEKNVLLFVEVEAIYMYLQ